MNQAPTDLHTHPSHAAHEVGEVLELLEVAWERARDAFGTAPLSAAQTRVLYLVEREPGINLTALGRALSAAAPSVTRLCDRLQAAGFLRRGPGAQDRREVELELTEAGTAHLRTLRHRREEALREAMERMRPESRQALLTGLRALSDTAGDPSSPPARTRLAG
ncbi:MarR family winged helix-turn-helix transcriptional regulator [Actinacidiphila rubida]|uniref:DNA-binding transcriptional regulator, MarR family n=1 Tax=Actinacidiphila rubida TaxID=310780 RepID=A0A1H8S0E1_9ACTN|nr:MarR family transcriptional regulator [Actinacidiphila rubida]SEO72007.1 DNA-binding transcriptional regulator, MarR family [Actinacidiphila rubida]